ncbi:MAG: DUF167 domain-containing protein [Dehalococcoidales bacterium]|nr:DUF167 domain-containing protein [Dehalococcoidales bacterium]
MRISVKVLPNAGKNEILGPVNGVWRIKIAAPPDKGKANKELIKFLSEILGVRKNNLDILKGHSSHNKILAFEGISPEEVAARLLGANKSTR